MNEGAAASLSVDVATTVNLIAGWNLLGNSSSGTLDVAEAFADGSRVGTVWKWIASSARWAFYAPSLIGQALIDYATDKGYEVLTTINSGEGFWVNARQATDIRLPGGKAVGPTALGPTMINGWNLVSTGETVTPRQFCEALNAGVTTLWAWDPIGNAWFFYAPGLEAQGATALASHIIGKGYIDFTAANKTLGVGVGFWVNKQ